MCAESNTHILKRLNRFIHSYIVYFCTFVRFPVYTYWKYAVHLKDSTVSERCRQKHAYFAFAKMKQWMGLDVVPTLSIDKYVCIICFLNIFYPIDTARSMSHQWNSKSYCFICLAYGCWCFIECLLIRLFDVSMFRCFGVTCADRLATHCFLALTVVSHFLSIQW